MGQWEHGGGFSVDGSVRIEAADRAGRERLLRYCARPPFALDRLRELDAEHLIYDPPKAGPGGSAPQCLTPLPPHPALDNAVRCWHKGNASVPSCARAPRRPGVLPGTCPGLRLFGVRTQDSAAPGATATPALRSPRPRDGAGRRRWATPTASISSTRPRSVRSACKTRGERFWGRRASIPKVRRIYVAVNIIRNLGR